jgi:SAM-dependent methyltransferase
MVYLSNYFRDHAKDNCKILDAGCGNGNYIIDENRKKISWAVGIDAAEESTSKNICLDEKHIGDLTSLPFENESFDVVVSLWVLEHLEFPAKVFGEIYRVLKHGGLFMFATPNKNYLPLIITKTLGSSGINNFVNQKLYGRNEVDIFKTYYLANTKKSIWTLSDSFSIRELRYNFDPSYTSFNNISYGVTKMLVNVTHSLGLNFWDAHIVGVLEKR